MTEVEVIENVPVNEEKEEKNTVGLVWMILSIIGLVLLITIIWAGLGLFLLCLGFILWVIGLFSKPRGKAWVAVIIPLIIAILMGSWIYYVWNSVKAPANEFTTWLEAQNEAKRFDGVDWDIFQQIASQEFNALVNQLTWDDSLWCCYRR